MAGGRHADVSAIHLARSATDDGNDRPAFHAYPRLEHHGAKCLQRLHIYHHLDHRVSHDKPAGAKVQTRITSVLASRLYSVYSDSRTFRDDERANVPRRRIGQESMTNVCSTDVTEGRDSELAFLFGSEATLQRQSFSFICFIAVL